MFTPPELFDLSQTEHASLFDDCQYSWEALKHLEPYLASKKFRSQKPQSFPGANIGEQVQIGEGTLIEPGATIKGPAIIGKNCRIRHNAFIREFVIIGNECVIGNSTEVKHSLLFNGVAAAHFNYVGDSILGFQSHLGAGVKISNLKVTAGNVFVIADRHRVDSGLRKFGALIGDHAEIGCNAVLNPGSVIGRGSLIYPLTNWRGTLPANAIAKNKAVVEVSPRQGAGAV
jgi:NDP-sugar pyrophosphorylase family protein